MKFGKISKDKDGNSILELDFWKILGTLTAPVFLTFLTFFFINLPNSCTQRKQLIRQEKFDRLTYLYELQDSIASIHLLNLFLESSILIDKNKNIKTHIDKKGFPSK